jgi:hydroxymethylpyrimidine/phosphomethylpyrimidine kinase
MANKPYVLSIAGFDPSSGAGITSDIKTFEQNGVYGLGACSAITYQNESEFEGVDWLPVENIIRQMEVLFRKYSIGYVKIGLVENLEVLYRLVFYLSGKNTCIVWDPIVNASAGYSFHSNWDIGLIKAIMANIYLLTPNLPEFIFIGNLLGLQSAPEFIHETQLKALLLKGGHNSGNECADNLYLEHNKVVSIKGNRIAGTEKHGTGCVLSSAIVAQLALGGNLPQACGYAKRYVEKFIQSNPILLGYHL